MEQPRDGKEDDAKKQQGSADLERGKGMGRECRPEGFRGEDEQRLVQQIKAVACHSDEPERTGDPWRPKSHVAAHAAGNRRSCGQGDTREDERPGGWRRIGNGPQAGPDPERAAGQKEGALVKIIVRKLGSDGPAKPVEERRGGDPKRQPVAGGGPEGKFDPSREPERLVPAPALYRSNRRDLRCWSSAECR